MEGNARAVVCDTSVVLTVMESPFVKGGVGLPGMVISPVSRGSHGDLAPWVGPAPRWSLTGKPARHDPRPLWAANAGGGWLFVWTVMAPEA